jgi:Leucine-rich repeat (LRR) protein
LEASETTTKFHGFKQSLDSLEFLKLSKFSFESATVFDNVTNLHTLELALCSNPAPNSNLLDTLTNLEQLTLNNKNLSDFKVKIPQNLKYLYLKCQLVKDEIGVEILDNLPNLISLRIEAMKYSNDSNFGESFLCGVPNLRKLEIANIPILLKCFSHLTNLTELLCSNLNLNGYDNCEVDYDDDNDEDNHGDGVDFEALKSLVNLKALHLTNCDIRELPANIFVNQKQLETLYLNSNWICDLNCEAFNGLENLRVLNLKRNELSKFDLAKLNEILVKLKRLEKIHLFYNNIHNELKPISNKLAELNIKSDFELVENLRFVHGININESDDDNQDYYYDEDKYGENRYPVAYRPAGI